MLEAGELLAVSSVLGLGGSPGAGELVLFQGLLGLPQPRQCLQGLDRLQEARSVTPAAF